MAYNSLIHEINLMFAKSVSYTGVIDLGCGTAPYKSIILETAEYISIDWKNCYQISQMLICRRCSGVPLISSVPIWWYHIKLWALREPDSFTECNHSKEKWTVLSVPFMYVFTKNHTITFAILDMD